LENYTANAGQTFNVTYILSLFIMIGQHGGSFIYSWLSSVSNTNIPLQIASLFECHYVFPLFVKCFNHSFQICNQGINMSKKVFLKTWEKSFAEMEMVFFFIFFILLFH